MRKATLLTAAVLASAGCGPSIIQQRAVAPKACDGTRVLIVHNNTSALVEVYEYRAGAKTILGAVGPGTQSLAVSGDAESYGAESPGGTEVLTATSRPRASDRVLLELGCR